MGLDANVRPVAPSIGPRDIVRQFWLDAYGKEVQSAATYSYMWMADQVGHMGLGIVLDFAFTALLNNLPKVIGLGSLFPNQFTIQLAGFLCTVALSSYWELSAYGADVAKAKGSLFPLQTRLLHHNAVAAAAYMSLGGGMGWAYHQTWHYSTPSILLILVIVVATAMPWVREKIIWQKAALPYLARLADMRPNTSAEVADALWSLICAPPPPIGPARVVVLGGPIGSGRTLVSCSIGTEFAFKSATVRYLPFSHLIEMATASDFELEAPLPGPSNIGFWPWSQAQVLIIDDLGPLVANSSQVAASGHNLGLSEVLADRLSNVREILSCRHTVWILGQWGAETQAALEESARIIGDFLGSADPLAVLLSASSPVIPVQLVKAPGAPTLVGA